MHIKQHKGIRYSVFYGPIIVAAHEFVSYGGSSGISISIVASLAETESSRRRIRSIRLILTASTSMSIRAASIFRETRKTESKIGKRYYKSDKVRPESGGARTLAQSLLALVKLTLPRVVKRDWTWYVHGIHLQGLSMVPSLRQFHNGVGN